MSQVVVKLQAKPKGLHAAEGLFEPHGRLGGYARLAVDNPRQCRACRRSKCESEINVKSVAVLEAENNPPVAGYRHAPVAFQFARKRMWGGDMSAISRQGTYSGIAVSKVA
jgi:hypothetical protein